MPVPIPFLASVSNAAEYTTPPAYTTLLPAAGDQNVAPTDDLQITFNEPVVQGAAGNITVTDGATPAVIDVLDASITISGNTVTIPNALFALNDVTDYHVLIDDAAFVDASVNANAYPGISDPAEWTFKTSDTTPPA